MIDVIKARIMLRQHDTEQARRDSPKLFDGEVEANLARQRGKMEKVLASFAERLKRNGLTAEERKIFKFLADASVVQIQMNLTESENGFDFDFTDPRFVFSRRPPNIDSDVRSTPYQRFLHEAKHVFDMYHSPLYVSARLDLPSIRGAPFLKLARELECNLVAFERDPDKAWTFTRDAYRSLAIELLALEHPLPAEITKFPKESFAYRNRAIRYFENDLGLKGQKAIEYIGREASQQNAYYMKALERGKELLGGPLGERYQAWVSQQLDIPELKDAYLALKTSPRNPGRAYLNAPGAKPGQYLIVDYPKPDEVALMLAAECPLRDVREAAKLRLDQFRSASSGAGSP